MIAHGFVTGFDAENLYITVPFTQQFLVEKREISECEIRLDDGRSISADQRKKIYATIRDISLWTGHVPEYLKELLKWDFMSETGTDYFSLSDCDMTTAREFLNHILEFCIREGVPMSDRMLDRSPDVGRSLYCCLANKVCCICGAKADLHHVDAVGMGRDRATIVHEGMEALPLCRLHHGEYHNVGKGVFFEKYHVFGIEMDRYLCEIWKLKTEGGNAE